MWSIYATSGFARHLYYLTPAQITNALEINTISRSLCMFSIAIGKISVAFLIERIAGPANWRKWLLRGISISIFISAVITFTLFYAQCRPVSAVWDKGMIKDGTGSCWNPIPVNTWDLVIASRSTFFTCKTDAKLQFSRLLGVLRFCSGLDPSRHGMETSIGPAEEVAVITPPRHGSLVSVSPSYDHDMAK